VIKKLDIDFTVCKVSDFSRVDFSRPFIFIAGTDEECSVVCETEYMPSNVTDYEHGWKALRLQGVIDFEEIGVIADISRIISGASMSLFVISTYNTDYVLLKEANFDKSIALLESHGYTLTDEGE